MNRSLYTDEVDETLRHVFGCYVQEVYDDPSVIDYDPDELAKVERAGAFLSVDVWDRDVVKTLSGFDVGDVAYDRLRAVRSGKLY